jgi:integrin alpha FG-GAP repeat containing protein 1
MMKPKEKNEKRSNKKKLITKSVALRHDMSCPSVVVLLFAAILLFNARSTSVVSSAKTPKFPGPGLFPISAGLENETGRIVAFGDFNADKFTDVFVLSPNEDEVSILLWSQKENSFEKDPTVRLPFDPLNPTSVRIRNVVPADFNHDGKLDVLLMGADTSKHDKLLLRIYYGGENNSIGMQCHMEVYMWVFNKHSMF